MGMVGYDYRLGGTYCVMSHADTAFPNRSSEGTPRPSLYYGKVNNSHIKAVVRAALRANGFSPNHENIHEERLRRKSAGLRLRDQVFREAMQIHPKIFNAYEDLRLSDLRLWRGIARVAGFGYRQATVLGNISGNMRLKCRDAVGIGGGAFNTIISLFDYVFSPSFTP
jgi:hypothetical protein